MQLEDMILVSIDDHMIEPPDMYKNHVPAKWADKVPEGRPQRPGDRPVGLPGPGDLDPVRHGGHRRAGPARSGASTRARTRELRPGCFDVHERVRDMNANGVLASMNFPTMAGFNARTFTESADKEIALVMLQAYNDWAIDEWCGAYPGRFIPLGIVPMWDVDLAVEEVHRVAQEGLPIHQLPRDPARPGVPELPVGPLGPDAEGHRPTRTWCSRSTSAPASA